MTDRDHFAAAALTGLLLYGDETVSQPQDTAGKAYALADAMLRERERTCVADCDTSARPVAESSVQNGVPKSYERNDENRAFSHTINGDAPVAWAVMLPDGTAYESTHHSEAWARSVAAEGREVVPLYRHPQPALTDEEREAIWDGARGLDGVHSLDYAKRANQAATLRSLLSRLA